MSITHRMSRVITFRMPSAPGWKLQYNMNDQHFTLIRFGEVKNRWQFTGTNVFPMNEIEHEAERVLQLETLAWQHDLATDAADSDFTDLFPSY